MTKKKEVTVLIEDIFTAKLKFANGSVSVIIPPNMRDRRKLDKAKEVTLGIVQVVE